MSGVSIATGVSSLDVLNPIDAAAVLAGIASRRDAGKFSVVSAKTFCRRAMMG